MTTHHHSRPTLADVQATLRGIADVKPAKRRRIENAFTSVWRYTGVALRDIPATMPGLVKIMQTIEPAAHGIKRATITNMRNLVMHGMKHSGLVPELAHYGEHRKPLSPSWSVVMSRVASLHEKTTLWSFVHYLNDDDLAPSTVSNAQFDAFVKHLEATSARANQHTLTRATGRYWNELRVRYPDLKLQELTTPASRLRRHSNAISDFPHPFQDDLKIYRAWLVGDDIFDDNARDRTVSELTADMYVRRIHRVVSILVAGGLPIEKVTGLRVLVEPDMFKRIRTGLQAADKSAQLTETFQTLIQLTQIAKDWLRCDGEHVQRLVKERKKIKKPVMVMTDKNKKLVAQFDDPETTKRLFKAPAEIWKRVKKDSKLSDRTRLAKAQAALGIGILTTMPLRLGNLTDLTFGKTIILRPGGTSSIIIPMEATKASRAIEFDIPDYLAVMLAEYFTDIAPAMLGCYPKQLFCRTDSVGKGFAQVRYLIQSYFKEYVGFHMNPHAFRHLCAKLILDNDPGAHTLVQELLGHKSVETSTAFYAGLSSRRAGRHHNALIQQTMEREDAAPGRRRKSGAK
jgi:integrase